ncbi:unnamed protein product [Rotaria sp. Silwood1]|nr:unnamed protein product [Rotaria sp. Silwood1]CAF0737918.1 unnamed protein product [Rotaria sp. Silwood1]CAF3332936.1 unnamed protein product [Rotaria sp. Silwood1]CAF4564795.1 unnamed protein product [Rotaria sp. Silwood1]
MQQEYTTTFLDITVNDIKDFKTIRHHFDKSHHYRLSMNEITHLLSNHETELKIQEEKYLQLFKEKQIIEKQIEEIKQSKLFNKIINQKENFISFPYRSFLNLRHWHRAPKRLKIFFQALAYLFSIKTNDFLTELKINPNLIRKIQFYQPSSTIMNEFRIKFFHLNEISLEYIRNKSLDAYTIAIWIYNIEKNERLKQLQQPEIENQKELKNKLIELNLNLFNKQKEIQLSEDKIKTLKETILQTEKHHHILLQSN